MWYLAYGSNVNPERFRLYLEGGVTEPGARDATPPAANGWFELPFRLNFALESQRWSGGGVAFVHPSTEHTAWFRGWNITAEQFEDVFAQENRRAVGSPLPWDELAEADHVDVGESWYRRVYPLQGLGLAEPAFTFTTIDELASNPPHEDYRSTIAGGMADHPDLTTAAIEAYLDASILG